MTNYISTKLKNNLRSSQRRCSVKKDVLRNFAKFTGKHLCQSLFLNKVAGTACNFIKKETLTQVFSFEFSEISKNTFFTEHVWATASVTLRKLAKQWHNNSIAQEIVFCILCRTTLSMLYGYITNNISI